jgi:hypothetical protein
LYDGAVLEEDAVSHKLVMTQQVRDWLRALRSGGSSPRRSIVSSMTARRSTAPWLTGSPGSRLHNLKELRPGSSGASEVRILLIFDPARNAVLLVADDKAGRWQEWYQGAIPAAEAVYEAYLKEQR